MVENNIVIIESEILNTYLAFIKEFFKSKADREEYQHKINSVNSYNSLQILQEISKHLYLYSKLKHSSHVEINIIDTYERKLAQYKEEIKFHIDLEAQLKRSIEYVESKLVHLENTKSRYESETDQTIENLKADNQTLSDLIQMRGLDNFDLKRSVTNTKLGSFSPDGKKESNLTEKVKLMKQVGLLRVAIKNDSKVIEDLKDKNLRLRNKNYQLKLQMSDLKNQIEFFKHANIQDQLKTFDSNDIKLSDDKLALHYKSKFEEKCLEIIQLEKKFKPFKQFTHHEIPSPKFTNLVPNYKSKVTLSPELKRYKSRSQRTGISTDFSSQRNSLQSIKMHRKSASNYPNCNTSRL